MEKLNDRLQYLFARNGKSYHCPGFLHMAAFVSQELGVEVSETDIEDLNLYLPARPNTEE
jgi:hypothetical protein